MSEQVPRREGRALFGRDSDGYRAARPDYPDRVYELLVDRCGLADGCHTIEVGAGSGLATRRMLELGARPLVVVEPDPGFARALDALARESGGAVVPVLAPFETADITEGTFDLAVAATSFHWLDREVGPKKLGACLRPGGWLALFWNVFGDPQELDPFHEATKSLLSGLAASPSQPSPRGLPFALDQRARRADFQAARADRDFTVEELRWTLTLRPPEIRSLYETFAPIARLPELERERLLDEITSVAERRFAGVVERRVVTPVYLGRRAE